MSEFLEAKMSERRFKKIQRIRGPALVFKNVRKRYQESRKSSENVRKNVRNFPNENFGLDLICWHFWIRFVFVIFLNTFSDIFAFGLIVWHSLTWANFLLFLIPNSDIFCLNRIFENFSVIFWCRQKCHEKYFEIDFDDLLNVHLLTVAWGLLP